MNVTIQTNIGTSKYVVTWHDGQKKHTDGSDFHDIAIFKNKKKMNSFIKNLKAKG